MPLLKRLAAATDGMDLLLVVGLVSLIGGIAELSRPCAAIVFGVLCLALWVWKSWGNR